MAPVRRATSEFVETMMEQQRDASGVAADTRSSDSDVADLDSIDPSMDRRTQVGY